MPSRDKEEFLSGVLRQIRFPFDRAGIKAELSDHISERVDHYLELGYEQDRAEAAVGDMGDPTECDVRFIKPLGVFTSRAFCCVEVAYQDPHLRVAQ